MKIVIDHLTGSRRGQRQEFDAGARVRFGRHPECEVSFDAQRDLDASSRHAELRPGDGSSWILVDVGSSNGTFLDGHRVTETSVRIGTPVAVEFGVGGPGVRLFIGDDDAAAALGAPPLGGDRRNWILIGIGASIFLVIVGLLAWLI